MKKSKFTETQIVSILKQADAGVAVKDVCRQAGTFDHDQGFYCHTLS